MNTDRQAAEGFIILWQFLLFKGGGTNQYPHKFSFSALIKIRGEK